MAVVNQKEGYVGDETRPRAGVRYCPKTARSVSLKQWEQMHLPTCLPSAAALFRRLLHQSAMDHAWAPEVDALLVEADMVCDGLPSFRHFCHLCCFAVRDVRDCHSPLSTCHLYSILC